MFLERDSNGQAVGTAAKATQGAKAGKAGRKICSDQAIWRPKREPDPASYPFGAPPCRIYRPSPSVMQAGRANARSWVLEFEATGLPEIEPLMGWVATDDPFSQVRLHFPTRAAAVDYAEREGLDYRVIEPPPHRPVRNSYRDVVLLGSDPRANGARSPQTRKIANAYQAKIEMEMNDELQFSDSLAGEIASGGHPRRHG
jgi:hypothetical protein